MFDVYLHSIRIGTLTPRGRGVRFQYAKGALENDRISALSLSVPKREEPFPDSRAGPFFRNLLPEQAYRRLIASAVGTAPDNSVALLGAIGGECPGAVSIWPAGSSPPSDPKYEPLDSRKLSRLFLTADRQTLGSAIRRGRLSLAGAQAKIALLRDDGGNWHLPLNGAVTSHILKEGTADFPHLLENELYCATLAGECGLLVPQVGLAAASVRVFCSERFDRPRPTRPAQQARDKLHQEDFCQVLAIDPERKYEADGGPGIKRCAAVMQRYSSLPADDLQRLIRWVGFNYLIGNEDAHAKNLALLYLPQGLRLTPHYDLVSTAVYSGLERKLAMKLGRSWDIRNVQGGDWRRVAAAVGLPWEQVRVALLELGSRVHAIALNVASAAEAQFGGAPVYKQVADVIARHTSSMERALGAR